MSSTTSAVRLFRRGEDGNLTDVRINGQTAVFPSASAAHEWIKANGEPGVAYTMRNAYAERRPG